MPTVPSERSLSLLLLPPPPYPSTPAALKTVYYETLFFVLTDLSRTLKQPSTASGILDIALPCDHLLQSYQRSTLRSTVFQETQQLLAGIYKLITIISVKAGIPNENGGGIDSRVILLAHSRNDKFEIQHDRRTDSEKDGPVIDMLTLASSDRVWQTIYCVDGELGQRIASGFLSLRVEPATLKTAPGCSIPPSVNERDPPTGSGVPGDAKRHLSVAVGGTFDHLHAGHKLLLSMTAFMIDDCPEGEESQTRHLVIGITGDEMLKNKKFAEYLQSWSERMKCADSFLRSILLFSDDAERRLAIRESREPGPNGHVVQARLPSGLVIDYVEILDPFGPTITDEEISALVISAETRSGGSAVNDKRREKGWLPLEVFEVDVLDADDAIDENAAQRDKIQESFQNKLSSTEIRRCMKEKTEAGGESIRQ